jgi:hypothetical protein
MSQFDWPINSYKETLESPQNKRFCFEFIPFGLAERRTTFAKAYGIKVRCYAEHVGNLGIISRTHWALEPGTYWEHIGN